MSIRGSFFANSRVRLAGRLAGGGGFYRRAGLERLVRDVHGVQFHPLPEKRQQLFIGRRALGVDPIGEVPMPVPKAAAA